MNSNSFVIGIAATILCAVLVASVVVMAMPSMWSGFPMGYGHHKMHEENDEYGDHVGDNATWHNEHMEDWGCPMH